MKKSLIVIVGFFMIASPYSTWAASLSNASCNAVGKKLTYKNLSYTCVQVGAKKTWQTAPDKKSKASSATKRKSNPKNPVSNSAQKNSSPNRENMGEEQTSKVAPQEPIKEKKFPSVELSKDDIYVNNQNCKLNNKSTQTDVHQGFNQGQFVLSTKKTIRSAIVPVDFPDLLGSGDTSTDFGYVAEGVSGYYSAISDGKITFEWKILPNYLRYPKKVADARLGGNDTSGFIDFSIEAKKLARQYIDTSKYDLLVFAPPLATTRAQIAFGPAFLSFSKEDINATMLDGQSYDKRNVIFPTTTAHEIGHLMGLADLYSFTSKEDVALGLEKSFESAQFKYMGGFDLMNHADGPGVELTAWNRWLLGVLEDKQIRCLPRLETRTLLTSVEIEGGVKGAVIPVSSNEVFVIESRKPIRYDLRLGRAGVLVYKVDTSVRSGYGPMTLIRRNGSSDYLGIDALLSENETLTIGKIQIKVLETGPSGDVVQVSYLE